MSVLITSRQNPRVLAVLRLRRIPPSESGCFFVEGEKLLGEALRSSHRIRALFVREGSEPVLPVALPPCEQVTVSAGVMARLSSLKSPSGVLAEFALDRSLLLDQPSPPGPWLALDGLQDPGNVGTIYRSAAAFGLPFLIQIPPAPDPFSEKVIRASAGASLRVPTWKPASVDDFRAAADRAGLRVAVLHPRGETDLTAMPAARRYLYVVGNEGHGVSEAIASEAPLRVRIPTSACTESLNASTAASLLLFTLGRAYRSGVPEV